MKYNSYYYVYECSYKLDGQCKKNAAKTRKLLYLSEIFFLCGSQIVQGQPAQHRQVEASRTT